MSHSRDCATAIRRSHPAPCPNCTSGITRLIHCGSALHPVPTFFCDACSRTFTRLHGTPLQNLHKKDKLFEFLQYLPHQRSLDSVAAEMSVTRVTVTSWLRRLRTLLLALDPSRHYAARVRLGQKPASPELWCPHCKKKAHVHRHGFWYARTKSGQAIRGARLFQCSICDSYFDRLDRLVRI
ncbi:hypothetical protein C5O80_07465 [Burkholderia sp. SRS-46]|nr:hypothetical protein C5O80_07465 [Burkholderia sp. SRS-46]